MPSTCILDHKSNELDLMSIKNKRPPCWYLSGGHVLSQFPNGTEWLRDVILEILWPLRVENDFD